MYLEELPQGEGGGEGLYFRLNGMAMILFPFHIDEPHASSILQIINQNGHRSEEATFKVPCQVSDIGHWSKMFKMRLQKYLKGYERRSHTPNLIELVKNEGGIKVLLIVGDWHLTCLTGTDMTTICLSK